MEERSALLIVDVQNDFCPGGTLPVPQGDRVVEPLTRLAARFAGRGLPVFASRDWHPPVSGHFREGGGAWPVHCVRGTHGADFHPALHLPADTVILSKGTDPHSDGYSAFEGTSDQGRPLLEILQGMNIDQLVIGGLATDYCVRATALEALHNGLKVTLVSDAVAGVDREPGDAARAVTELAAAGAILARASEVLIS